MHLQIQVALADGFATFHGEVPDGSDLECCKLPHQTSRAEFWSYTRRTGFDLGKECAEREPAGEQMIKETAIGGKPRTCATIYGERAA